ncbi:hypothetical protein P7C73_g2738, partial [Tremellales sp. Uapishka_1]
MGRNSDTTSSASSDNDSGYESGSTSDRSKRRRSGREDTSRRSRSKESASRSRSTTRSDSRDTAPSRRKPPDRSSDKATSSRSGRTRSTSGDSSSTSDTKSRSRGSSKNRRSASAPPSMSQIASACDRLEKEIDNGSITNEKDLAPCTRTLARLHNRNVFVDDKDYTSRIKGAPLSADNLMKWFKENAESDPELSESARLVYNRFRKVQQEDATLDLETDTAAFKNDTAARLGKVLAGYDTALSATEFSKLQTHVTWSLSEMAGMTEVTQADRDRIYRSWEKQLAPLTEKMRKLEHLHLPVGLSRKKRKRAKAEAMKKASSMSTQSSKDGTSSDGGTSSPGGSSASS